MHNNIKNKFYNIKNYILVLVLGFYNLFMILWNSINIWTLICNSKPMSVSIKQDFQEHGAKISVKTAAK